MGTCEVKDASEPVPIFIKEEPLCMEALLALQDLAIREILEI
jgi:hypothetical protein